ncbi:hypothetical protein EXT67_21120 [Pectobacterium atrosepticum]|uniref:Putative membrane protein n=1 Tax=Pectobacterium phage phiTE TaxID=1116482 RepID=K9L585_9CAUD|nr:hypothetical protein [Pectobacterium atrosepticum]YP_007392666.1 Rz-like spanin [Pectobacterium phage phiTE]ARB11705.1 putative membrane protein [Pectobacterium phage vB_PatM_CB7]QQG33574.1 hypothetical protein [Pectobacterium phage PcCB7V]AEZ66370.1 putative membrane protein [Pectobacterium phage phiTE]MCL6318800.1 hypothetical protein [Pectobacterium atrosepticum]
MATFIDKYKKYLIGIGIAVLLLFSFNWYVGTKEDAAYALGFQSANTQWEKKGKEYVDLIDKGKADNTALNEELARVSEEKRKLEEARRHNVSDKQVEYNKTEAARKKGLDDDFVDLYNESLGD